MQEVLIVAIVLVRNEDIYLEKILRNISDFCDKIIIADHMSTDDTAEISKRFCRENKKGEYHRIKHPAFSHELIKKFVSHKVWVFGVDGDELYDPPRLAVLRKKLKAGEFDKYWMILGNTLNCMNVDWEGQTATGYMAPPARSMTKLYNFGAINSWEGECPERLHGGNISFKVGYTELDRYYLYKEIPWEESVFRCLHLCFLPRSSNDKEGGQGVIIRKNIADGMSENIYQRIRNKIRRFLGQSETSPLKREKYMRGDIKSVEINSF